MAYVQTCTLGFYPGGEEQIHVLVIFCFTCLIYIASFLQIATDEQKLYKQKLIDKRKHNKITEEQKENYEKFRDQYENSRQPLLVGLTSDYDLQLFQQAQAKACEELVRNMFVGISLGPVCMISISRAVM